jgi:release factor glutamine methyltransferase
VSVSARDALARGVARLREAGIDSARLDVRVLLAQATDIAADAIFGSEAVSAGQLACFDAVVARRAAREPLAYITGEKEFWSLPFAVGPGVLIPRPETETLIDSALRDFADSACAVRVLDVGTGSGCLLIAFLRERPHATGLGIDNSEAALAYARRNALRHDLAGRCRLELCPIPGHSFACEFDVIFANPPYLTDAEFEASAPEIHDHEPQEALAAGPDGFAGIREVARLLPRALDAAGRAYIEVGVGQAPAAAGILGAAGLEVRRVEPDLSGVPRCLVIGRPGKGGP